MRADIIEEFCDAQDVLRMQLRSTSWRAHSDSGKSLDTMSDEELLASAWSELSGRTLWSPVGQSAKSTDLYNATVRRMLASGATQQEIADAVGRTKRAVQDYMHRNGMRGNRLLREAGAMMATQYGAGMSLRQIANEHGCSAGTVRTILLLNGVSCREQRRAPRLCAAVKARRIEQMDETKVVELYLDGKSTRAVSRILGCCQRTVICVLRRRGVLRRAAVRTVTADDAAIVALYKTGLTVRQVAKAKRVGKQSVLNALKRAGVKSRSKSEALMLRANRLLEQAAQAA